MGVADSDMKSKWSERLPICGRLPVGGGLHTQAKAAASLCGICVQASGGVVLDCSNATDPNSIYRCLNWVVWGSKDPRADCASLAILSWDRSQLRARA